MKIIRGELSPSGNLDRARANAAGRSRAAVRGQNILSWWEMARPSYPAPVTRCGPAGRMGTNPAGGQGHGGLPWLLPE